MLQFIPLTFAAWLFIGGSASAWDIGNFREGMSEAAGRKALEQKYGKASEDVGPSGQRAISGSSRKEKINDSLHLHLCDGVVSGFSHLMGGLTGKQAGVIIDEGMKARASVGWGGPSEDFSAIVLKINDRLSLHLGAEGYGRFYIMRHVDPRCRGR